MNSMSWKKAARQKRGSGLRLGLGLRLEFGERGQRSETDIIIYVSLSGGFHLCDAVRHVHLGVISVTQPCIERWCERQTTEREMGRVGEGSRKEEGRDGDGFEG